MCRKRSHLVCFGLLLALAGAGVAWGDTWEGKVTDNQDSVEQSNPTSSGNMDFGSSDLEFMADGGTQTIGLRFLNVQVPAGATITKAYVVLTTEEIHTGTVHIIIQAHLTPDAPAFSSTPGDISKRPLTKAVVQWSPEYWAVDNESHQTSDISTVIEQVVGQAGWVAGNAIVVVFNQDPALTSTGYRTTHKAAATGYEPLLHIEYTFGAGAPNPADGQTQVARDMDLSWSAGKYAASTEGQTVFFSTNRDDVTNGVGGVTQSATTFDLGRLEFGTTYYWRVRQNNAAPNAGVTEGAVWSFTTEQSVDPIPGQNIVATASSVGLPTSGPENTVNGSGLDAGDRHGTDPTTMWLSGLGASGAWIQYEFDQVYKLHEMQVWNSNQATEVLLGIGVKDVTVEHSTNGTDWTVLANVSQFARASGANGYGQNTTVSFGDVPARYVRLRPSSNWGGFLPQYSLSEVRFFYIPVTAAAPSPASGAAEVDVDVVLGWQAGREAATHKVYVSTDKQAVIGGTAPMATVTKASYGPGALTLQTIYYWKVTEVNETQLPTTWEGSVWSFTTSDHVVVEDFESYNDVPEEAIFTVWVDGYENPANGSQVGYLTAPFAETRILHGGKQSMPLTYANTNGASYSEGTRTFAQPQDWTAHGVTTLVLWFRGTADNTGQMYAKINGAKVPYSGAAANLALEAWQQWSIDLAPLGLNLKSVRSLTVGIDGNGATGTLYFDDISLLGSAPAPINEWRIANDNDDVEESLATLGMDITSSDIELPYENAGQGNLQIIGLRFPGLAIPRGALITEAWVRFQVDGTKDGALPVNLLIEGERSPDAAGFGSTALVSTRPRTTAQVKWSVPNWTTVGDQGPDQTTPNLASIIQEIVNQEGWTGSALVLIFSDDPAHPSEGIRCAEGGPGEDAPLLHISYK